jgi:hypothetical protein
MGGFYMDAGIGLRLCVGHMHHFFFSAGYGYKKSERKKSARAYGVISGLPAIPLCLLRDLCGLQTKKLNIPLHPFPFGSADS